MQCKFYFWIFGVCFDEFHQVWQIWEISIVFSRKLADLLHYHNIPIFVEKSIQQRFVILIGENAQIAFAVRIIGKEFRSIFPVSFQRATTNIQIANNQRNAVGHCQLIQIFYGIIGKTVANSQNFNGFLLRFSGIQWERQAFAQPNNGKQ
jgi:hypothetical protein